MLFSARGLAGYDPEHPDERLACNHPLLLLAGGRAIGTTRLDCGGGGVGTIRMVAIRTGYQRQGHGRAMMRLVEDYARDQGLNRLEVNSAPDAVEFYARLGWILIEPRREIPLLRLSL